MSSACEPSGIHSGSDYDVWGWTLQIITSGGYFACDEVTKCKQRRLDVNYNSQSTAIACTLLPHRKQSSSRSLSISKSTPKNRSEVCLSGRRAAAWQLGFRVQGSATSPHCRIVLIVYDLVGGGCFELHALPEPVRVECVSVFGRVPDPVTCGDTVLVRQQGDNPHPNHVQYVEATCSRGCNPRPLRSKETVCKVSILP